MSEAKRVSNTFFEVDKEGRVKITVIEDYEHGRFTAMDSFYWEKDIKEVLLIFAGALKTQVERSLVIEEKSHKYAINRLKECEEKIEKNLPSTRYWKEEAEKCKKEIERTIAMTKRYRKILKFLIGLINSLKE